MTPTPEQIAAAKAWMKGEPTMEQEAILREFNPCCATSHNAARILLAALEAAEADGARLAGDLVEYGTTLAAEWHWKRDSSDSNEREMRQLDEVIANAESHAARKEAQP